jgi:hypothetical protein
LPKPDEACDQLLKPILATSTRNPKPTNVQAITWHGMFAREVRLREAMKRLVAALWRRGAGGGGGGSSYSAHDAIVGLESGELLSRYCVAGPPLTGC